MRIEFFLNTSFICFLSVYIFSLFLTLGSGRSEFYITRMWAGGILAAVYFAQAFLRWKKSENSMTAIRGYRVGYWSLAAFVLFLVWLFARAGVGACFHYLWNSTDVRYVFYYKNIMFWTVGFGLFAMGFYLVRQRRVAEFLLLILSISTFFLSLNLLPHQLTGDNQGYQVNGESFLFWPFLYAFPWVEKYLLGGLLNPNYTGDMAAIGGFTALALSFYYLQIFLEQIHRRFDPESLGRSIFYVIIALMGTGVLLLLLSRGSIMALAFTLGVFCVMVGLKFGKKISFVVVLIMLAGAIFVGISWLGNIKSMKTEIQSLRNETAGQGVSFAENREGARRAIHIYYSFQPWGVGTHGYEKYSPRYAHFGYRGGAADRYVMCYYLQVLAEEGSGAFLYFLFLISYGVETIYGLFKTQSRFKFLAGVGLFCAALLILSHGMIGYLLQQVPFFLLLHFLMGMTLAILGKDFAHQAEPAKIGAVA